MIISNRIEEEFSRAGLKFEKTRSSDHLDIYKFESCILPEQRVGIMRIGANFISIEMEVRWWTGSYGTTVQYCPEDPNFDPEILAQKVAKALP